LLSGLSRRPLLAAILLLLVSTATLAGLEARPRDGRDVAAVYPPWMTGASAFERVAQAGGAIVRAGALDTILVAHGDDPDFAVRLRDGGAWLVLDPLALGGCLLGNSNSHEGARYEPNS
jgi:hypothetical protein